MTIVVDQLHNGKPEEGQAPTDDHGPKKLPPISAAIQLLDPVDTRVFGELLHDAGAVLTDTV